MEIGRIRMGVMAIMESRLTGRQENNKDKKDRLAASQKKACIHHTRSGLQLDQVSGHSTSSREVQQHASVG